MSDQPESVHGGSRADDAKRVLVVDDSADAADTTATLLEVAGCVTRAIYRGDQTLAEIDEFKP